MIARVSGTIRGLLSMATQSTGFRLKNLAKPSLKSLYRTPNFTLRGLSSWPLCCQPCGKGTWLASSSRLARSSKSGMLSIGPSMCSLELGSKCKIWMMCLTVSRLPTLSMLYYATIRRSCSMLLTGSADPDGGILAPPDAPGPPALLPAALGLLPARSFGWAPVVDPYLLIAAGWPTPRLLLSGAW